MTEMSMSMNEQYDLVMKEVPEMIEEATEYCDHLEPFKGEYGLQSLAELYSKIREELILGNHETPSTLAVIGPSGAGKSTILSDLFLLASHDPDIKDTPRRFLRWGRMIDEYGQIVQPNIDIEKGSLTPQMHDEVARYASEKVQTITETLRGIPALLGVELVGFPGLPLDINNVATDAHMENKNRGLQALSYIAQNGGYVLATIPDEAQIARAAYIRNKIATEDTSELVSENNISVYGSASAVEEEWRALSAPAEAILKMQDDLVNDMLIWHKLGIVDLSSEEVNADQVLTELRNNVEYRTQMLGERVMPVFLSLLGFDSDHALIVKNKLTDHTPLFLNTLRVSEIGGENKL